MTSDNRMASKPKKTEAELLTALATTKSARVAFKQLKNLALLGESKNFTPAPCLKPECIVKCLRSYVFHMVKSIRLCTVKVLSQYCTSAAFVRSLLTHNIQYGLTAILDRNKAAEPERVVTVRLVRQMIEYDPDSFPACIVRSLIAIAETKEEPMQLICLETLMELAARAPATTASCGGIHTLFAEAIDPKTDSTVQECLIQVILYLFNDEKCRQYISMEHDFGILFAPLSDLTPNYYGELGEVNEEHRGRRWKVAQRAVALLTKNWTGLTALASSGGISTLVCALKLPSLPLNDLILDLLYEMFRLTPPKSTYNPFENSSSNVATSKKFQIATLPARKALFHHYLMAQYRAVLLVMVVESGLVQACIDLANRMKSIDEDDDSTAARRKAISLKCTILVGELLHLSNSHLSPRQCAKLQTLSVTVSRAMDFEVDARLRSLSSTMVSNLQMYSHIKGTEHELDITNTTISLTGANRWRRVKGYDRMLDRIDDVKNKMDIQMKETTFRTKLAETQVLLVKANDWKRWKWDLISELLDGPLQNISFVEETLKTKFFNRILSFLRPFNKQFSLLNHHGNEPKNKRYGLIACQTLEVLVSSPAGVSCLEKNALVPQIAEILEIEVEKKDKSKDRLLGPGQWTMAREYFSMLGTLSSTESGLAIIDKSNIFDILAKTFGLPGRSDLSRSVMSSLDYNISGPARVLLSRALKSPQIEIRYLATRHLQQLLRSGAHNFAEWGIRGLVGQLVDKASKVSKLALAVLEEACADVGCLDKLISHKMEDLRLQSHGKPGEVIMMRFLSRDGGVEKLARTSFLKHELEKWSTTGYLDYLDEVEHKFSVTLDRRGWELGDTAKHNESLKLPCHFFGELGQTELGCSHLKKAKVLPQFIEMIKDDATDSRNQRGALWLIANVAKSSAGLAFLSEQADIMSIIVQRALHSRCIAIRGTAFFCLSMVARSPMGKKRMEEFGWECPLDITHQVCVPRDLSACGLLKVRPYTYQGSMSSFSEPNVVFTGNDAKQMTEMLNCVNLLVVPFRSKMMRDIIESARKRKENMKMGCWFKSVELRAAVFRALASTQFNHFYRRFVTFMFNTLFVEDFEFESWTSCMPKVRFSTPLPTLPPVLARQKTLQREDSVILTSRLDFGDPMGGMEEEKEKEKKKRKKHTSAPYKARSGGHTRTSSLGPATSDDAIAADTSASPPSSPSLTPSATPSSSTPALPTSSTSSSTTTSVSSSTSSGLAAVTKLKLVPPPLPTTMAPPPIPSSLGASTSLSPTGHSPVVTTEQSGTPGRVTKNVGVIAQTGDDTTHRPRVGTWEKSNGSAGERGTIKGVKTPKAGSDRVVEK